MRQWFWSLLLGGFLFFIYLLIYFNNQNRELINPLLEIEDSPTPTISVIPSDIITPTASLSAVLAEAVVTSPSPIIKKITPTAKPTPTVAESEAVYRLIDKYAPMSGIDPNVVRYIALCESGFRSNAVNGIYVGLFQFAPQSWKNIRIEMGEDPNVDLRFSPEDSIKTVIYALSKGKEKMWPNCIPK